MNFGPGIIGAVLVAVLVSAGCLSAIFPEPVPEPVVVTPEPTPLPTTESPVATVPVSRMALQPTDIPSDYILKSRSDITYLEMDPVDHDLGWKAGYSVSYYRMNEEKYDMTGLRQVIQIYTLANMKKIYDIQKDTIESQTYETTAFYELPCPKIGDRTFAYRITDKINPLSLSTYTIIFTKKDVYEELTMGGTTTDYETLKGLAKTAADKIR
ncbi:MAG TPA: hypothetical protein PKM50_02210 [Methanoregula sp.]|nr:hypothetical protein [Methanoregula sp.]